MHWNSLVMQMQANWVKLDGHSYKPWAEEPALSCQSAADSTGRDEVREEEREHGHRMVRDAVWESTCLKLQSTQCEGRGWRAEGMDVTASGF